MGSDIPGLTAEVLTDAVEALRNHDVGANNCGIIDHILTARQRAVHSKYDSLTSDTLKAMHQPLIETQMRRLPL